MRSKEIAIDRRLDREFALLSHSIERAFICANYNLRVIAFSIG